MQISSNIARRSLLEAMGLPVPPSHPEVALNVILQMDPRLAGTPMRVSLYLQKPDGSARLLGHDKPVVCEPAGNLVVFSIDEDDVILSIMVAPEALFGSVSEDEGAKHESND